MDQADKRWTQWLQAHNRNEPSFLVEIDNLSNFIWMVNSEVRTPAQHIGRLVHYGFPFDTQIQHQRHGAEGGASFRMIGDPAAARAAIGTEVMIWPGGIYDDSIPADGS